MYGVCWAPVVKRIIISTRKERREKKTRNKQGLVALVNARKAKELLIILQTAANSNWKLRALLGKHREGNKIKKKKRLKKKKGLLFN